MFAVGPIARIGVRKERVSVCVCVCVCVFAVRPDLVHEETKTTVRV